MRNQESTARMVWIVVLAAALATLSLASTASARPEIWARFNSCPSANSSTFKCINLLAQRGRIVLGKKTVPIVNPVTLQGGVTEPVERGEEFVSHLIAPVDGAETLSKTSQPVPGGVAGLINCSGISNLLLRLGCEAFENGLAGVDATVELAKPASETEISESNLGSEEGIALSVPVKVHLESPFLGDSCYVGSSRAPIIWSLTTGATSPPAGSASIHGKGGTLKLLEKSQIAEVSGTELLDNTWPAPRADGCGGPIVDLLINPIINTQIGLPSAAGKNTTILNSKPFFALPEAVNEHP